MIDSRWFITDDCGNYLRLIDLRAIIASTTPQEIRYERIGVPDITLIYRGREYPRALRAIARTLVTPLVIGVGRTHR